VPKERKPETIIRELKRQVRDLEERLSVWYAEVKRYENEAQKRRGEATQAKQEAAEWRGRFDKLLARVPLAALKPEGSE
jgi:uncharacterized coiled-coil DUF342 family protein